MLKENGMVRYLILLLLFLSTSVYSQENDSKAEKLKLLKMFNSADEKQKILLLKMLMQICDSKEKDKQNEEMKQKIDELSQKIEGMEDKVQSNTENIETLKTTTQYTIVKKSEDERFWVYTDGTILDTKTKLEWYVGPDHDTSHYEAEKYVKNLTVAGGGWRLPMIDELRNIYEPSKKSGKYSCLDPVFSIRGGFIVWSGEQEIRQNLFYARYFDFFNDHDNWFTRGHGKYCRVFGVRSGKH